MILPAAKDRNAREKRMQGGLCQGNALDTAAAICTLPLGAVVQKFASAIRRHPEANF